MRNSRIKEKDNDIPAIICFAGCDWWYHNRGLFAPQVMSRLARHYKVLFVNSLGLRFPSLKKDRYAARKIIRKLRSIARFLQKDVNGMYVMSPVSVPFLGSPLGRALNTHCVLLQIRVAMFLLSIRSPIFYIGCPPAWEVVKRIGYSYLIYERTDLFEEMPGANKSYITSLDNDLVESSNLVLYVDTAMYRKGVKKNPDSLLIGHGIDFPLFANAEKSDYIPEDIAKIPKPIVGYFGEIYDKDFDFDLLQHLATNLPYVSFVMIGPLSSNTDALERFKNVYILGPKRYEDIPHYGKVFDVSILPRKKNRWVIHSYPVKIKEYLALGNPFVSVDIPAIEPFEDVIYVARNYDDFVFKLRQAVKDKDPQARKKRRERVRSETWESKVTQIINFIGKSSA